MSDAIVFISYGRVREGQLEALKEFSKETFPAIEADKPATVMQVGYLNEAGTEVHFVHVFPDADAMDAHFVGAGERSQKASEFIETKGFEVYGTPSETALSMLSQAPGVDLGVMPLTLGGFIRLTT